MNSQIKTIINKVLMMDDAKVEIDKDVITVKVKKWDGYKSISAFHSQEIIGGGFVSMSEIYKILELQLPKAT